MRILYFTGITSTALAFLGGMAASAAVLWALSPQVSCGTSQAAPGAVPLSSRVAEQLSTPTLPQSVLDEGRQASWGWISEPSADGGFRFPTLCEGEAFGQDLGCAAVREAVNLQGNRLGMQVLRLDGCDLCRDLGLTRGDIVTHVGRHRHGQPVSYDETGTYLDWWRTLFKRPEVSTLTLRVLRDGRPALLTRLTPGADR